MLQSLPEETTQLLIDLCTTTGPLVPDEAEAAVTVSPTTKPNAPGPSYLSYLALNRSVAAPTTVSSETATPPSPSQKTVRADNASTRREPSIITQDVGGAAASGSRSSTPPATTSNRASVIRDRTPGLSSGAAPPVRKLSPRIYFPHFVDHMEQFVIFLETVAMRRWGQGVENLATGTIGLLSLDGQVSPVTIEDEQGVLLDKMDQVAVWNTLLELYLTLPLRGGTVTEKVKEGEAGEQETPKKKVFDEKTMRDKAMRVLRSDVIPYDSTHALILCSTHGFTLGLVLLWEKKGMYEDVLRFWMDKDREGNSPGASQKVIDHLMQYGHEHPHLYQLVLRFLSSTPELLKRHQDDLREVVEYIDEEGIMAPLNIIQVLSRNDVASIGLVKEWLIKRITVSQTGIQNVSCPFFFFGCKDDGTKFQDQELTKSYRLETAAILTKVNELSDTVHPQVFHVTRCSSCHGQLDLPSSHFMCKDSYHQRCVGDPFCLRRCIFIIWLYRCIADNETECPLCAPAHGVIRANRSNNEKLAYQHDRFVSSVQEKGSEAVAIGFSRGLSTLKLEEAAA